MSACVCGDRIFSSMHNEHFVSKENPLEMTSLFRFFFCISSQQQCTTSSFVRECEYLFSQRKVHIFLRGASITFYFMLLLCLGVSWIHRIKTWKYTSLYSETDLVTSQMYTGILKLSQWGFVYDGVRFICRIKPQ